ncbi:MAG TPA: 2OG-Fe(II) oxygenase [Xanthomonadaceae bacterium]|nr:2OG-Fe(II) oxygenase [Xanthomonadaceae bacterium]
MSSTEDFIEVYENALPAARCAALIERFETSGAATPGRVGSGVIRELKDSADIHISGPQEWREVEAELNAVVLEGLVRYLRRYHYALIAPLMLQIPDPASGEPRRLASEDFQTLPDARLREIATAVLRPGAINLQRYTAGSGGYPYWHCELYPKDAGCETLHRVLLWTIYLNEGFQAGETEFLYQQRRIVPRTGALLIAPTAFTHTHRGNTPVGRDKYIATSWILFQRAEALYGPPPG